LSKEEIPMSELTQCNYCDLKSIKARAERDNLKVTKIKVDWGLGGYDILVHPKEVEKPELDRDKYFVAWMMEIGKFCEC
jgi:hypothetical protein